MQRKLRLTIHSINSIDALLESDDFNEAPTDVLKQELRDAIDDLLERKGSSTSSREASLVTYVRILTAHHLADVLYGRVNDLLAAFGRSVKAETSSKENNLALRAISLTAISIQSDELYDTVSSLLRRTISDSQSPSTKAAALHTLGICISFGGVDETEIAETLTFLQEIVSSDGSFIGADDSAEVVTAALHTYGFLATQVEDLEDESEDAIEALLEQLNSSDAHVQIAAGEVIALLFEKSYTPREDDETQSELEDDSDDDDDEPSSTNHKSAGDPSLVKRYNAYHNASEVLSRTQALAGLSTRSMNKVDKKRLHQSFTSISMTVENPRVGLQTNNASKMTVRIHREGQMKVDKWWKLMRLNALRRLLGGGFVNHYYEGNKQVLNSLPMILRGSGDAGGAASPRRVKARAGDKFRDSRRFVSADMD